MVTKQTAVYTPNQSSRPAVFFFVSRRIKAFVFKSEFIGEKVTSCRKKIISSFNALTCATDVSIQFCNSLILFRTPLI